MSSTDATNALLVATTTTKKAKKPGFRPSPRRAAPKRSKKVSLGIEDTQNGNDESSNSIPQESSQTDDTRSNATTHVDDDDVIQSTPTAGAAPGTQKKATPKRKGTPVAPKGRPRKRKSTALAVGSSISSSTTSASASTSTSVVVVQAKDASSTDDDNNNNNNGALVPLRTTREKVGAAVRTANDDDDNHSAAVSPAAAAHERQQLRQEASSPSSSAKNHHHMPLELIPPVIPENTTGEPTLTSFCRAFPKPKQRRLDRVDAAAGAAEPQTTAPREAANDRLTAAAAEETGPARPQPAGPVVQIVNGEIVLQEASVVFQGAGAGNTGGGDDGEPMTVVEEEADLAIVGATYTSFATGRRARPKTGHWNVEETLLFYDALRQVGLDFGTMEAYFETSENPEIRKKQRRQLKKKYKSESIRNPDLIEKALQPAGRMGIDLSVFDLTQASVDEMQLEAVEKNTEPMPDDASKEEDGVVVDETTEAEATIAKDAAAMDRELFSDTDGDDVEDRDGHRTAAGAADDDFLWPDATTENTTPVAEQDDPMEDPILFDGQDVEEEEEEAPTIALVHGPASSKKKKKVKPNFRSSRKKMSKAK